MNNSNSVATKLKTALINFYRSNNSKDAMKVEKLLEELKIACPKDFAVIKSRCEEYATKIVYGEVPVIKKR